jgi:hypothetical protein
MTAAMPRALRSSPAAATSAAIPAASAAAFA